MTPFFARRRAGAALVLAGLRVCAQGPAVAQQAPKLSPHALDTKLPHHLPFQVTPFTQSASVLPG